MLVKPEASLPDGSSLEQLASEFEIFFQAKVKRIQENLVSDADYVPPDECPCACVLNSTYYCLKPKMR